MKSEFKLYDHWKRRANDEKVGKLHFVFKKAKTRGKEIRFQILFPFLHNFMELRNREL